MADTKAAEAKTVPVILLADVWDETGERIFASPVDYKDELTSKEVRTQVRHLSLPLAKAMIAAEKATRADPLPGE